jgi:hypothetical protein
MNAISSRALHALAFVLCATFFASVAFARPVVITEHVRLGPDDPDVRFEQVAIDGDDLLTIAHHYTAAGTGEYFSVEHYQRRSDGNWQYVSQLAAVPDRGNPALPPLIALKDGIGAATISEFFAGVFERTGSGWTVTEVPLPGPVSGAKIVGSTVAFGFRGVAPMSVALVRKNASGIWAVDDIIAGPAGNQEPEWVGPRDFSLTDNEAILVGPWDGPSQLVFDRVNGQWTLTQTPPFGFGTLLFEDRVALRVGNQTEPGDMETFHARDANGDYTIPYKLLTDEAYAERRPGTDFNHIFAQGDRIFVANNWCDTIAVASVYRRESPQRFRHEATLALSDSYPWAGCFVHEISVSGERVAFAFGPVYIFDVPAELPLPFRWEETFIYGEATDWRKTAGSWVVVKQNGSYALRQKQLSGVGRVTLDLTIIHSDNQAIQADITMHSGAGPGPWAGLMLRYTDAQNYYYLLVDRDSIDIRRIVNGVFEPIATAPFSLVMGQRYRFRLEAIGQRLRAYLDGEVVADVLDDSHAEGQSGLIAWRMITDYDNIVSTGTPYTALFQDPFDRDDWRMPWEFIPESAWTRTRLPNDVTVLRQSSSAISRAISGGPAKDQIITVDVTPRSFQSKDAWVGVLARYVDENNYYYVAWKNDGRVSLRKRVDGVITKLSEAKMTIRRNRTYRLRLESIGNSLRYYIDGAFIGEAHLIDHMEGRYGLMTDRAVADFDTFSAMRP